MPILLLLLFVSAPAAAQQSSDPAVVRQIVGHLGSFDFETRRDAARTLRRSPVEIVGRELEQAVRAHTDEYVRYRAFVLLSGLDETAAGRVAMEFIADRNDRLRTAVYQWFEHHPRPDVLGRLLDALPREDSEFVRPALTRAIAAYGTDARAAAALRPLVLKGEDLFRGSVIGAIGDYGGRYAFDDVVAVARQDGPLQDDAITALGRLGDARGVEVVRALQESAPRELQPTVSAALCLLGVDCAARLEYLMSVLQFASTNDGYQPLLRGATHGLAMLAAAGNAAAFDALVDAGANARETARAPIALSLGTVALRNPAEVVKAIGRRESVASLGVLLRDAFDMLSEDLEEERFGAALRRTLWEAPDGSRTRRAATELIDILEF